MGSGNCDNTTGRPWTAGPFLRLTAHQKAWSLQPSSCQAGVSVIRLCQPPNGIWGIGFLTLGHCQTARISSAEMTEFRSNQSNPVALYPGSFWKSSGVNSKACELWGLYVTACPSRPNRSALVLDFCDLSARNLHYRLTRHMTLPVGVTPAHSPSLAKYIHGKRLLLPLEELRNAQPESF